MHCGLSFTVTLFNIYFVSTTLSILARRNGSKVYIFLTSLLYYCQHLIIASLLYLFLSGFSYEEFNEVIKDSTSIELASISNVLRKNISSSQSNWVLYYYYYRYFVNPWQYILSHSTPFFTLSEGFFTILAIQAIGETNRWLYYERNSNIWIISSLLTSGGVITVSLYYLYRIYVTPIWQLSAQTASLLGFVLSIVCGIGLYGIISDKGSVIESSLFFAYIVRCIYEISPKLATSATDEILELFKEVWQTHQGNIPMADDIITYYHKVILKNSEAIWDLVLSRTKYNGNFNKSYLSVFSTQNIWFYLQPIWRFAKNFTLSVPFSISELSSLTLKMASESVSPAVVINLCFRILIFYSATRIIPALQRRDIRDSRRSRRIMKVLYWYSPCILIAMYTHLILQYSGELKSELCLWGCNKKWFQSDEKIIVDAWGFWNWGNIFWTILVYGSELVGSPTKDIQ